MSDLIRNFADDFAQMVQSQPDEIAFIVAEEVKPFEVTYAQLDTLVNRCLQHFKNKNLKAGDTLFSMMPNSLETIVIFLASIKGGYAFAPLACTMTQKEVERWIALTKPSYCFTTNLISDEAKKAVDGASVPVEYIEVNNQLDWLPSVYDSEDMSCDGASVYLATSGTTGEPKAMVIDTNKLWSSGVAFMKFHGFDGQKLRFWNYLPMSYLGGLFNLALIPMATGGSAVIDESFSGKTFLKFWSTIERYDINSVWFVPSIVRGLLKISARNSEDQLLQWGSKIKASFIGTAPIDLESKEKFEKMLGITMFENFALSETTFFTSESPDNIDKRGEGTMGQILPYADLKFVEVEQDDDDQKAYEIHVKSPFLFKGYLDGEGGLTNSFVDGYLPTGDLGYLDDNKNLVINGRKRDIIKKGGYFIALREIEILLERHPSVQEAIAVKTPHEFYIESYNCHVILKEGGSPEILDDINSYIHKNLVQYKWPEKVTIENDFPRTASGKVRKHLLAA